MTMSQNELRTKFEIEEQLGTKF